MAKKKYEPRFETQQHTIEDTKKRDEIRKDAYKKELNKIKGDEKPKDNSRWEDDKTRKFCDIYLRCKQTLVKSICEEATGEYLGDAPNKDNIYKDTRTDEEMDGRVDDTFYDYLPFEDDTMDMGGLGTCDGCLVSVQMLDRMSWYESSNHFPPTHFSAQELQGFYLSCDVVEKDVKSYGMGLKYACTSPDGNLEKVENIQARNGGRAFTPQEIMQMFFNTVNRAAKQIIKAASPYNLSQNQLDAFVNRYWSSPSPALKMAGWLGQGKSPQYVLDNWINYQSHAGKLDERNQLSKDWFAGKYGGLTMVSGGRGGGKRRRRGRRRRRRGGGRGNNAIVQVAMSFVTQGNHGTGEYSQSGPRNPEVGSADCSSFVRYCVKKATGIDIGFNTSDQLKKAADAGKLVWHMNGSAGTLPSSGLAPGDVIFNRASSSGKAGYTWGVGHVTIYIGGGKLVSWGRPSGGNPWVSGAGCYGDRYVGVARYT